MALDPINSLPAEISIQDIWYTIVTILLALSLISERITNMFKLYSGKLRTKRVFAPDEKLRERGVMWRALLSGWFVAVVAGADLFLLVSKGQLVNIFTDFPDAFGQRVSMLFGIFLSGIFISLGSKFWHDVLDIVLEVSNLKKYRAQSARSPDVEELEVLRNADIQALQNKIDILLPEIRKIEGYAGYDFSTDLKGKTVAAIQFKGKGPEIPEKIFTVFKENEVRIEAFTVLPALS